jgi:hypothetical protein
MSETKNYLTIPSRMTPCNVHSFYSTINVIEDFPRLMGQWEQEAITAAGTLYSGPFRLVSTSHSFWGRILTATYTFEEL